MDGGKEGLKGGGQADGGKNRIKKQLVVTLLTFPVHSERHLSAVK